MNPREFSPSLRGVVVDRPATRSQFDLDLENAEQYFGDSFPGNEGLTCRKCGCAVNLGWQHIAWHEGRS